MRIHPTECHRRQLLPGVKVVIANPDTKGQCADSHLGEVSSDEIGCSAVRYCNFNLFS